MNNNMNNQNPGGFHQQPPNQGGYQNPGGFHQQPPNQGGNQNPGGFNQQPPNQGGYQNPGGFHNNPGGFNNQNPNAGGFNGGGNVNPHWLGPQSAYYVNINDPKQRKHVLLGVKRRVISAMGGAQKYEGSPVQGSATVVTAKNNPVIFQDAVLDAFTKESGGVIAPPLDSFTVHPIHHYDVQHPCVDHLTTMRIEVLLDFLPPDMAVVTTYNNTRFHDMPIHDIRGGKRNVPHHHVTLLDMLRLFVEEESRKHATRALSAQAFGGISINPSESWLAAASRLIRYYRAFIVNPEEPYSAEERYIWSLLSASNWSSYRRRRSKCASPLLSTAPPRKPTLTSTRTSGRLSWNTRCTSSDMS